MKSSLFYSPINLQRKNQPPHHHEIREGLCQYVKCLYTRMKNGHTKYLLKYCNAIVIVKKHLRTAFFLLQRGVLNSTWCEQRISEVLWLGYNCKLLYWSVLKQWKGHGMRGFENQIDFCTTLTLWPNWCSLW